MSLYKARRDLSGFKRFLYKTWKAWHSWFNKKLYLLQVEVCEVYSLSPLRFSHLLLHIAFLRRVVQQFLLPKHRNINSSFRSDTDHITNHNHHTKQILDECRKEPSIIKVGAYFCYCAYVLRISRYRDIFARFKTMRRNQKQQVFLISKMKIGGSHAFFRDNKALIWKKTPYTVLYFTAF